VSTALSSTERPAVRSGRWAEASRALSDLAPLLRFRAAGLRGRSRRLVVIGLGIMLAVTVLAAWLPAYLPNGDNRRTDVLNLLPTALFGVLLISIVSAAASGGGRELLPRDEAVAFPVSPTTDHLGALLMAPLNIAWLLQAWTLLGAIAYVAGPTPGLVLSQLLILLWLATATAIAQVVGWSVEYLRRTRGGVWSVRALMAGFGLGGAYVISAGLLVGLLEKSPTLNIVVASLQGRRGITWLYVEVALVLAVGALAAVGVGAVVAAAVARRPARDVLRLETSTHASRSNPPSDLTALMRTDRVGIWRSVPLRRGLAVLAVMPGLVAIAGNLQWDMLTILPGLVASGGALLFGVNSWCLDGRGALWRDSLPLDPRLVFTSRVFVLVEVLLVATIGTVLFACLRAGLPTGDQLAAVACAAVVVVLQVVSASLRWSVRRPFSVDLRSARATPAPPMVMVGYSARLALSTTSIGIFFSLLAHVSWEWSVLCALPFALVSALRLVRTAHVWADPVVRSHVVATVAS
jgi:hypothetical protein